MAEVFLCEKGQLSDPSKAALRKAGVVVVEVADPSKCQFIKSTETISADDMLWATLDALNHAPQQYGDGKAQREKLAVNLLRIVNDQRAPRRTLISPSDPTASRS